MASVGARTAEATCVRAHAYAPLLRYVVAALRAAGWASLAAILFLVLTANDPPVTPPVLIRLVVVLALLPALAAALVERAVAAEVELRGGVLALRRRDVALEVPRDAIEEVLPWRLPLPGSGFSLRLRSGRWLRWGLQIADPAPLLAALADAGVRTARAALDHPSVVWAHARAVVRVPWYHRLAKFPLFGLAPTAVLFNAHQHIAYGALLGEYYLLGLASYLETFAVYWATVTIYLVLYAGVWRALAEVIAWLGAHVAPSRAARMRRGIEIGCRVAYYAGVPVLLLLRFLP